MEFEPLVRAACPDLVAWERVVYQLEDLRPISTSAGAEIRRLEEADVPEMANLSPESDWVMKTWGGVSGAAKSGMAWGAFVAGKLASIACPFFVGLQYEDLGVATEPAYRGRGLSTACTYALIQGVLREEQWAEADREFYFVIREELEQFAAVPDAPTYGRSVRP